MNLAPAPVADRCGRCGEDAAWIRDAAGELRCAGCGGGAEAVRIAPAFEAPEEGRYRLAFHDLGITLDLGRIRWERHQLIGELLVRCSLAGAQTFDGVLAVGDFNLSSVQARSQRAKYLASRARSGAGIDWEGMLEEFSQRVLTAERNGRPAVLLRELERPSAEDASILVDGFPLLARHPTILFGDGGSTKSYLALYLAGSLDLVRKRRVALFDWELAGEDHRDRLERLFGAEMPGVYYVRCDQPLYRMVDSVSRTIRERGIEWAVFDSVALACDGRPEEAEVAGRYFQALRQLGPLGSLHIAHVSKTAEGADLKPFGSVFWHNMARSSWNVKLAEGNPGDDALTIALHHRKANLGKKSPSLGFEVLFRPDRTVFRRVDPASVPELAIGLSVLQRIKASVRADALSTEELVTELHDVKPETVRRTINRAVGAGTLVKFPGPTERIGLPYRGKP